MCVLYCERAFIIKPYVVVGFIKKKKKIGFQITVCVHYAHTIFLFTCSYYYCALILILHSYNPKIFLRRDAPNLNFENIYTKIIIHSTCLRSSLGLPGTVSFYVFFFFTLTIFSAYNFRS